MCKNSYFLLIALSLWNKKEKGFILFHIIAVPVLDLLLYSYF